MRKVIKLLVLAGFVIGLFAYLSYGYDRITQELSNVISKSYGKIGAQLSSDTSCQKTCNDLQQVGQDMKAVNSNAQSALKASLSR